MKLMYKVVCEETGEVYNTVYVPYEYDDELGMYVFRTSAGIFGFTENNGEVSITPINAHI